ncbi:MAG: hypothetical protein J6R96_09880, partial [Spirochaetaceae bacterium]|nr:hypothetical protein [Spirochaetaceae bacterium]
TFGFFLGMGLGWRTIGLWLSPIFFAFWRLVRKILDILFFPLGFILKKIIDTADKVIHHDVDEYGFKVLELTFQGKSQGNGNQDKQEKYYCSWN